MFAIIIKIIILLLVITRLLYLFKSQKNKAHAIEINILLYLSSANIVSFFNFGSVNNPIVISLIASFGLFFLLLILFKIIDKKCNKDSD